VILRPRKTPNLPTASSQVLPWVITEDTNLKSLTIPASFSLLLCLRWNSASKPWWYLRAEAELPC
jgi:hypothetical protein